MNYTRVLTFDLNRASSERREGSVDSMLPLSGLLIGKKFFYIEPGTGIDYGQREPDEEPSSYDELECGIMEDIRRLFWRGWGDVVVVDYFGFSNRVG